MVDAFEKFLSSLSIKKFLVALKINKCKSFFGRIFHITVRMKLSSKNGSLKRRMEILVEFLQKWE